MSTGGCISEAGAAFSEASLGHCVMAFVLLILKACDLFEYAPCYAHKCMHQSGHKQKLQQEALFLSVHTWFQLETELLRHMPPVVHFAALPPQGPTVMHHTAM